MFSVGKAAWRYHFSHGDHLDKQESRSYPDV